MVVKMEYGGGLGRHNQCGISLLKLVFSTYTREVILLIYKELVFLEKVFIQKFWPIEHEKT